MADSPDSRELEENHYCKDKIRRRYWREDKREERMRGEQTDKMINGHKK